MEGEVGKGREGRVPHLFHPTLTTVCNQSTLWLEDFNELTYLLKFDWLCGNVQTLQSKYNKTKSDIKQNKNVKWILHVSKIYSQTNVKCCLNQNYKH